MHYFDKNVSKSKMAATTWSNKKVAQNWFKNYSSILEYSQQYSKVILDHFSECLGRACKLNLLKSDETTFTSHDCTMSMHLSVTLLRESQVGTNQSVSYIWPCVLNWAGFV